MKQRYHGDRPELRKRNDIRQRFSARIERRGVKPGQGRGGVPTLLLVELRDFATGQLLADHVWIAQGRWGRLLPDGCEIAFDARIAPYRKGHGYASTTEYKVQRPSRIEVRNPDSGEWLPAPAPPPAAKTKGKGKGKSLD